VIDERLEVGAHHVERLPERLRLAGVHRDLIPRRGEHLGEAGTHGPSPEHRYLLDILYFHRLPLFLSVSLVIYMEASTEIRDVQGDKILLSALEASIPYFLKYGRIDLDHASVLGQIRGQKVNPYAFEIGKPLDVRVEGGSIWVKAAIFSGIDGSNRFTEAADIFWDSLNTVPSVVWFPSIAGDVYAEQTIQDEGLPTQEVRGIRWHSIGLSRTPVNTAIGSVTTTPIRAFAKAFSGLADLTETLGSLAPEIRRTGLQKPLTSVPGVDDPVLIRVAMEAFSQASEEGGIDEYLTLASERGVPVEVAMALLVVLMSRH